ncbi:protein BIG GRAIN 1-like B [Primulina eburnea]|uniref:protein BIG GRAIN 1-like B n=1 Tax=Primulina eburnea TaxID=1245227 RepID=UPI003C6C145A
MYNSSGEENYKSRRHSKNNPSFSSTLLDQIYSSIDANAEDFKPKKEAKMSQNGFRFVKTCSTDDYDEEMVTVKRRPTLFPEDDDFLFFSSSSSYSSGALSSSDTEFMGRVSCLSSKTRPKPIRTAGFLENQTNKSEDDDMIKFKSRASKIYANFRKVKQPISPGGRLTSFLNSLFHNTNGKKGKKLDPDCLSATRSCLSGMSRNGNGRTVRLNPIVNEDSGACGHKCIYLEISDKFRRPPLPQPNASAELKSSLREGKAHDALRGFHIKSSSKFTKTEDDDGVLSDSSSDLFELDHLNMFGIDRFCEELPVYETTRLDATKRSGVSRLIR